MGARQMVWLYDDIITSHPLYKNFGKTLAEISDKDYPGYNYFQEHIEAIALDSYETYLSGGQNDRSVDAVVGICNERQGTPCNERLILVELRMGYRNVNQLSPSEIRQKEVHSRDLLMSCRVPTRLDLSLCLVFDPSVISQAGSWINRSQTEHPYARNWIAFSPSTFCNHVNAGKQFPYTPKTETIYYGNRFKASVSIQDLDNLDEEFKTIRDYLTICRNRYEKGECDYLCRCIRETLEQLKAWNFTDIDDTELFEIIIKDIEDLLQ